MRLELMSSVESILKEVEVITGKPIKFVEKSDLGVFATVKIARKSMPAHIIIYRKQHDPIINHLIAHECGHILRMFGVPEEKRLIPAKTKDESTILHELDKDLKKLSSIIPMRDLMRIVGSWRDGLILQLTNYPSDIMIEKWIYDSNPDLRHYQLKSLEMQRDHALGALSRDIQRITPPKIYNASNIMNYAFFSILEGYLKIDIAAPYHRTPFQKKGKQLVKLTEKESMNTYEGDIAMVNKWADYLGLSKWFEWVGFEDVPEGYLNSV